MYQLDENSAAIKQPKGLKIRLRPHQLTSIAAMRRLEQDSSIVVDMPTVNSKLYQSVRHKIHDAEDFTRSTFVIDTNSAILADKVGSGKTFMIIGLILAKAKPETHNRFIMGTDHFSIKMINVREAVGVNLIVVPHNLTDQWGTFCDKSSLKYIKLNTLADFNIFFDIEYVDRQGPAPLDPLVIYHATRRKKLPEKKPKKGKGSKTNKNTGVVYEKKTLSQAKIRRFLDTKHVFILNVNRYRFFKQIFKNIVWARVIIDEMDSVTIPVTFDEFGNFNWFLTATPQSIFYKSCRRYVNKIFGYNQNLLDYFIIRNKDEFVDKSIILPKPHVFMIHTMLQKVVGAIRDLIPQDVLQMVNAGNMKEAVAKLNCNVDTEENIVKVLTDKILTESHNLKVELEYVKQLRPIDQAKVKKLEENIRKNQCKLDLVSERIDSIKKECCFICAENFDTPTILDCCKSVFCLKCLLQALKVADNKCPFCRHVIKNHKEYHVITIKKPPVKKETMKTGKSFGEMDKPDVLEAILKYLKQNDPGTKILIFSDYHQTFDKIVKNISNAKMTHARIAGIPAHITNTVDNFRAGTINILMLDSQHYGSGLNLQCADYLILFHRMTPELETQVIGRAHRFGRKRPLKIIYLINDSERKISALTKTPIQITATGDLKLITEENGPNGPAVPEFEEYVDDDSDVDENLDPIVPETDIRQFDRDTIDSDSDDPINLEELDEAEINNPKIRATIFKKKTKHKKKAKSTARRTKPKKVRRDYASSDSDLENLLAQL